MSHRHINRRKFIGEASCAAVGTTAFLSSILNLGMINTISARPHIIGGNDYKAMVCILLAGGADTFNVLVPTESSEYADYVATRGDLALSNNSTPPELLDLDYNDNGREFAVHAGMPEVRDLFDNGDLAFLANIGTLIEPITDAADYNSGTKNIPLGLYSHSDQIMQWQTSVPQSRSAVGVGGRMADVLNSMNSIDEISMNISLAGKNRFQSGNNVVEYSIDRNTTENSVGFDGFPSWWNNHGHLTASRDSAHANMVEQTYANLFQETYGNLGQQNIESNKIFKTALGNVIPITSSFSSTNLSEDLKKITEVMSVRTHLGACRQIFFVTFGGWDHHDDVIGSQNVMLPIVSAALKEFKDALVEKNLYDDVVTFTISDFARTLTSNGNGSDHAWGGNQMIMGGPIEGQNIYGDYPSLNLSSNLNLSDRGRILPTTSVDEFYAELALWFGASPNDLDYILPNLCNFYSTSGCPANVPNNYMPIGMFS
jgi:uncharacterized protein (DUF1501 family)